MQISYDSLTGQRKYQFSGLDSKNIVELNKLITNKDSVVGIISPTQFRLVTEDKSIVEFVSDKPESLSYWLKEFGVLNYDFMKQPHDYVIQITPAHTNAFLQNNNAVEPYYFQFDLTMENYSGGASPKEDLKSSLLGENCILYYSAVNTTLPSEAIGVSNSIKTVGIPRIIGKRFDAIVNEKKYFYSKQIELFDNKCTTSLSNFFSSSNSSNHNNVLFKISDEKFKSLENEMSYFASGCQNNFMQYHLLPSDDKPWNTHCFDSVSRITRDGLSIEYGDFLDSNYFHRDTYANVANLFYLKLPNASITSKVSIAGKFFKYAAKGLYEIFHGFLIESTDLFNSKDENIESTFVKGVHLFKCSNNSYMYLGATNELLVADLNTEKNEFCLTHTYKESNPEEKICTMIAKLEDNFVHEIDCSRELTINDSQCWYDE